MYFYCNSIKKVTDQILQYKWNVPRVKVKVNDKTISVEGNDRQFRASCRLPFIPISLSFLFTRYLDCYCWLAFIYPNDKVIHWIERQCIYYDRFVASFGVLASSVVSCRRWQRRTPLGDINNAIAHALLFPPSLLLLNLSLF